MKKLSPLWMSFKARTCLFSYLEGLWKHFHHCGRPSKLVHAYLAIRRDFEAFSPLWRSCEVLVHLFECQEGPWKMFLPLSIYIPWSSCRQFLPRTSTIVKTASRSLLTPKQVYKSFTELPPWSKLLSESLLTLKLAWIIFTRPSQDLHSGKNLPARASQNLDSSKKGFQGPSWHTNRRARASQDLHSSENCFLNPFWHTNRHEQASQDLHSGSSCRQVFTTVEV